MKNTSIIDRFGITGILFVLGLIISSFVLINTIDIASRVTKEDISNNNYSERIYYRLSYNEKKLSKEEYNDTVRYIIDCLKELNCNSSIEDVGICVNNQIDDMFPEIVINTGDDFKLQLTDTKSYTPDDNLYQLIVGESIVNLTDNHKGNKLDVSGIQVPIQGVFLNNNAASIDYSMMFIYDNCDQELKQYLFSQISDMFSSFDIQVNLYSDDTLEGEDKKFLRNMDERSIVCEKYTPRYGVSDYQNYWYRFYNKIFITVCMIFSLFTCFSLSYLWISSRKKEIAIRKAFGYSNKKIFLLVTKDIFRLTVPAIMVSMIIEVLYCLVFDNMSFFDKFFILKFVGVLLGAFIIGILCTVNVMQEVTKTAPISAIREE